MKLFLFFIFLNAFMAFSMALSMELPHFEIYAHGEKPGLNAKISKDKSVNLEMAQGEFETFTLRLPQGSGLDLISNVKLIWAQKTAPEIELQTFWLGGHHFTGSSARPGRKEGEVADIPIPLEWIEKAWIKPPVENYLKQSTFLFEVFTDPKAIPGEYTGRIEFLFKKTPFQIPLKLIIHDLRLPNQFALETSFGFAPWQALQKHYGAWHKAEMDLYAQYLDLALEHRVDLHKIYVKFPEPEALDPLVDSRIEAQGFLKQTKPLFDGSLHQKNFSMTVTDLPVPLEYKSLKPAPPLTLEKVKNFWVRLNASVVKNQLQKKSFVYFVDEPKKEDLAELAKTLLQIRQWAPDIRFLVTTPYTASLEGAINLWCINLFLWDRPTEKSPSFYAKRQAEKKEELWFYVGCNSHGCDGPEDIMNPDLVIDRPAAFTRVLPWMALRFGATGILYFDTVYGYTKDSKSPWTDAFHFTGYGEGNLFYPCTAKLGSCSTPRVIPALRLKILRDGLEDVQILKMAQDKGVDISPWLTKWTPGVRSFSTRALDYESAKREVLNILTKAKFKEAPKGKSENTIPKK